MSKLTAQQVSAAWNSAFPGGKNSKGQTIDQKGFVKYWVGKEDTALRDKLRTDPYAMGVYKNYPKTGGTQSTPSSNLLFGGKFLVKDNIIWTPSGDRPLNKEERGMLGLATDRAWDTPEELASFKSKGYVLDDTPLGLDSADWNNLSPNEKIITKEMVTLLDEIKKRGQVINPNIKITPEQTAKFMQQAEKEINPYYSTQVKLAKEQLLKSIGYDEQTVLKFEQDTAKEFKKSYTGLGEQAADAGLALSGKRRVQEGNLISDTQGTIDEQRRQLTNRSEELARAFAQQYQGLPGLSAIPQPTISAIPKVGATATGVAGQFTTSGGEKPLYTLSPNIYNKLIGTQEYQRQAALSSRASELESAFRQKQSINQQRQLTL